MPEEVIAFRSLLPLLIPNSHGLGLEPAPYELRFICRSESDTLLTAPGTGPALELALALAVIGNPMVCMRSSLRGLGPDRKRVGGNKFFVQHEAEDTEVLRQGGLGRPLVVKIVTPHCTTGGSRSRGSHLA